MINLNTLKKVYYASPRIIQKLIGIIPFRCRVPNTYMEWRELLKSEPINSQNYIFKKIDDSLRIAGNLPGYNFDPERPFENIPLLDKKDVQKNLNDFLNKDLGTNERFYVTTGGSTGKQAKFYQSNNVWWKELAFFHDFFKKIGFEPGDLKGSFRGGDFKEVNTEENIFWKKNPIYNELHFSPFHINDANISSYVNKLNQERPLYFHAYPSSVLNLIRCMKKNSLSLDYQLKGILLISEQFTSQEEKKIKDFFNCEVISFYGLSERIVFAGSLDDCSSYKVDDRYGYFELVDEEGNIITENDKKGEIVGTSFDNLAMPLIRYRTGDFTSYKNYDRKVISRIEGKWDKSFLIGKNDQRIYLAALNFHDEVFEKVYSYQYKQISTGDVKIFIVPNVNFEKSDVGLIKERHIERVGNIIDFAVEVIDKPILSSRGKFLKLIK